MGRKRRRKEEREEAKWGLGVVSLGNSFRGEEGVGPVVIHGMSVAAHDGFGLLMEIPDHGIGMPSSKDFDEVRVDVAAEQGHGSTSTERTCADVAVLEPCHGRWQLRPCRVNW